MVHLTKIMTAAAQGNAAAVRANAAKNVAARAAISSAGSRRRPNGLLN
jgi:hypothetical protein